MIEKLWLNIDDAMIWYHLLMKNLDEKYSYYLRFGFSTKGSITFKEWELFSAILCGDVAKDGHGADLTCHEVKSAAKGNSYEYQYHRNTSVQKLEEDKLCPHIFIKYWDDYESVDVYRISACIMQPTIESWRNYVEQTYGKSPKLRCRRSITQKFVESKGDLILSIRNRCIA